MNRKYSFIKYALALSVAASICSGPVYAGTEADGVWDMAPTKPKQAKVPQVRDSAAKQSDNFNISSSEPAPCTGLEEEDEDCTRTLPLGLQKKQSFAVFSRSPMEKINETLYSKATGDHVIKSSSSQLISAFLTQNYVNPAMAAASQGAYGLSLEMGQARDTADMAFIEQLKQTQHGTLLFNSYQGCINTWLRANKGGTYSEAQEKCMGANVASAPQKGFEERPNGSFQGEGGATTGFSFFDYPGLRDVKRSQSNLFSDADEINGEGIRLTSLLFNPEIQAALGINNSGKLNNREVSVGVQALRDSFRILIGDYKWKIEDRKSGEFSFQKIAPSDPVAAQSGLWGLREALFKQAYHTIFAIEYGHCLVADGRTEWVLNEPFPESDFWLAALKSSEQWVSGDSNWYFYEKEKPLRLNRKTLVQHFASLSVGPFIFDRNREGDLWTTMKDKFYRKVDDEAPTCDIFKSWEKGNTAFEKVLQKHYTARNLNSAISELATAIAEAQMYAFFGECLETISAVSNTVLDEGMKNVASGLILSFVNYQDISAQYNNALNRVGSWFGVIASEAQSIRDQGLEMANSVRDNSRVEKRNK
ncbi:MAG: hypothetical protein GYA55_12440 [SAR324 cluster bacterium]|uniref:Uncharacterized protein n=1 Tax=SAR324 cluster bacterium TaxID=2024889 RepID=A0A7X9FU78_9DELT|nr:hypothetical protein [SAR324 cluster bacterium]